MNQDSKSLYPTSFVEAGGCDVALKFNLCLRDYAQVCSSVGLLLLHIQLQTPQLVLFSPLI